jgi:hypothetical protein
MLLCLLITRERNMKTNLTAFKLFIIICLGIIFVGCENEPQIVYITEYVPEYIPTDDYGGVLEFTRVSFVRHWSGASHQFSYFSLDFVFGRDIYNFSVNDIIITDETGIGITKGSLTRTDPGRYELKVTNVTKNGSIKVSVEKDNYIFNPSFRNITVNSSTEYPIY